VNPHLQPLEDEQIHTVLTKPKKTRLIAEAKIKTDRLDARIFADLLRANLLSASYVPPEIRMQRSIIRERARLSRLRTIIENKSGLIRIVRVSPADGPTSPEGLRRALGRLS
jgi:transposase